MMRWMPVGALVACATLAAPAARADVLLPGGRPPEPSRITVTGTLAELTEGHITIDTTQLGGGRRTFALASPARTAALGLRLGDPVAVVLVGRGNPASAPVTFIDRILPVADLRLRVFTAGAAAAPAALGQGPGCWVAGDADNVEVCFVSATDAVALRYGADGKLACSVRLAPAPARGGWTPAAAPSCSGTVRWGLALVRCDAATTGCAVTVADRASAETLAMTRR